ncbi:MAG: hypothetical protein ACAH21_11395 [Ramlibacter sp.]|nr:hypothetical protein [Ramlibacter sp.]
MNVKRRRRINFEACSVALFASMALGGSPTAARAQIVPPAVRSAPSPMPPTKPAPPGLRRNPASFLPDGSVSSPGFDENLK